MHIVAIPDLHAPWIHKKTLSAIYDYVSDCKNAPVIVQLGDTFDLYSLSKFARGQNLLTPQDELQEGRKIVATMWETLHKISPKSRLIQLSGNHDARLEKRIEEKMPELVGLVSLDKMWKFPNVRTIMSDREYLELDGVLYMHGYLGALGAHMNYFSRSVVRGHSHKAGVVYTTTANNNVLFEMECGFAADRSAVPLRYTSSIYTKWVCGFGIIENRRPRFVAT